MEIDLTEDEVKLIVALRRDRLLRKAVFRYFQALSGIELNHE